MSARPRCFYCGRGLSAKHCPTPEARLVAAIFNIGLACTADTERLLEKRRTSA